MKLINVFLAAVLICVAPLVAAQEEAPAGPWAGKASLGYLATSGNTDNSSLSAAFTVGYTAGDWVHTLDGTAHNATQSDVTTAEAYTVGWKSERTLSEFSFLFGRLDWRKDRFSGYDEQLSEAVGYGRYLINRERYILNGEVGVGARQSDLVDGSSENEAILTGGLYFTWKLSDTATFTQDLLVEAGSENTYLEARTALSAKLVGSMALVASFTVKNNSDVPVGVEKTDTFTGLSLEYTF